MGHVWFLYPGLGPPGKTPKISTDLDGWERVTDSSSRLDIFGRTLIEKNKILKTCYAEVSREEAWRSRFSLHASFTESEPLV
jgi:hypothetical protein